MYFFDLETGLAICEQPQRSPSKPAPSVAEQ
jgi:hypothetical protein